MAAVKLPYQILNNGDWGIVLANQVFGGLHYKETHEEMEAISMNLKQPGMLCYVGLDTPSKEGGESKPMMYQWDGEAWVEFGKALKINGGIMCVKKAEVKELNPEGYEDYNPDLYDLDTMKNGNLIYVEDSDEGGTYMQNVVTYDEEGNPVSNTYTEKINGFDPLYRCTEPVPMDEKNVAVGNLTAKKYTRTELETMTVDKIMSYILFKEIPPFVTAGSGSLTASNQEVGSTINTATMFTTSQTSIKYGYVLVGEKYNSTTADYTIGDITVSGTVVKYGTPDNNKGSVTFSYTGDKLPLYTSWGNPTWIDDAGVEHEQVFLETPDITKSATINGYYKWNYYYNTSKAGVMTGPTEDLESIPESTFTDMTACASTYIYASNGYVTVGDTSKIGGAAYNTSFIYVILPDELTIDKSNCKIVHGVNGTLDTLSADWITKTTITNAKGKMSQYYGMNVWQIAKSGVNPDPSGKETVTNNDQAIKLAVKAV